MTSPKFRTCTRRGRLVLLAIASALSFAAGLGAAPLDLSRVPLIVNNSVPPNLLVTFDDSGSMGFGYTPDEIEFRDVDTDGNGQANLCTWRLARYYSPSYNKQYFDPNFNYPPPLKADGTAMPQASFSGAYRNGFGSASGGFGASGTAINLGSQYEVVFSLQEDAVEANVAHAAVTVAPATPMGAHTPCNGQNQQTIRDLDNKTARFPFGATAFYYRFRVEDGACQADSLNGACFEAINVTTQSAAVQNAFANWFSYYRTRSLTARTAMSRSFARIDPSNRVAWQNLNSTTYNLPATTSIGPLASTRRSDFFSWLYQSPASGGTPLRAATIRAGGFFQRAGGNVDTNPYYDAGLGRELSCRQNFHLMVTDGYWNEGNPGGVPAGMSGSDNTNYSLPDGVAYATGVAASRVYWNQGAQSGTACGNTGEIGCNPTLADIAFYYWSRDLRTLTNNVPRYAGDLSTGVTGAVVSPPFPGNDWAQVPEIYFNPANNPARWQHMSNFIVSFGVVGSLEYDDDTGTALPTQPELLQRLRTGAGGLRWPEAARNEGRAVDDAWHAAVNSRGRAINAKDPQELSDAISSLLESISARGANAAGSAAASSSILNTDRTNRYYGTFDPSDWSGDLIAFEVDGNGLACPEKDPALSSENPIQTCLNSAGSGVVWRAQPGLNVRNPNDRVILSSNAASGPGAGVAFRVGGGLSATQLAWLNTHPGTGLPDGLGSARLDFLRGDRSQDQSNSGPFRERQSVLGAIIGSSTLYVSAPSAGYNFTQAFPEGGSYAAFARANRNRRSMVYANANDGMLHAFDAGIPAQRGPDGLFGTPDDVPAVPGTGREEFAYVPYETFRNINRLTSPRYSFTPTADGVPVAKDVFLGGRWRTVLLSGLRTGGQGVFALDITNPGGVSEATASSTVLWEFSDDAPGGVARRLGYTYGRPNFARLSDGRWVALIPGGYNNDAAVDYATRGTANAGVDTEVGDGSASLFIVSLDSGTLIREVLLPASAVGLAEPVVGDYEGDFIDDVAVMGDVAGNIWRVDLRPGNWSVDQLFRPTTPGLQPITARPRLFPDPITQGFTVVVGTGKFIELGDRSTAIPRQAIMGVRDLGAGSTRYPAAVGNMVEQRFSGLSGGFFAMAAPREVRPDQAGWYILLGNTGLSPLLQGERVIEPALAYFQPGFALFESFIPSDDPCEPERKGAVYAFAAADGAWTIPGGGAAAALAGGTVTGGGVGGGQNAFDTNNDRRVNASDSANTVGRVDFTRPPNLSSSLASPGGGSVNIGGATLPSPVWRRRGWREIED